MAVGRQPVLPEGLEQAGVAVGRRGIEVDSHMMTSVPGIYAIGDVNGQCMLAQAATAQGMVALAHITGKESAVKPGIVPSAVFTQPELAMVGLTEEQCKAQELDVTVKKGFFRSNGKALSMGETDGLLKMIVSNTDRTIVGCHICGPHASDLIQEVVMAMNAGSTVGDLAASIPHPQRGSAGRCPPVLTHSNRHTRGAATESGRSPALHFHPPTQSRQSPHNVTQKASFGAANA